MKCSASLSSTSGVVFKANLNYNCRQDQFIGTESQQISNRTIYKPFYYKPFLFRHRACSEVYSLGWWNCLIVNVATKSAIKRDTRLLPEPQRLRGPSRPRGRRGSPCRGPRQQRPPCARKSERRGRALTARASSWAGPGLGPCAGRVLHTAAQPAPYEVAPEEAAPGEATDLRAAGGPEAPPAGAARPSENSCGSSQVHR